MRRGSMTSKAAWLAGLAAVALLATGAGRWAMAAEPWESVLRTQLGETYNCTVAHFVFVREQPLGKETGLEGRVRCVDGREYDFTRQRVHEKFSIRLCQPTVC